MKHTKTAAALICAALMTGQLEGAQIEQLCCFSPNTTIHAELERSGKSEFELDVTPTGHTEQIKVQVVYIKGPVKDGDVDRRACCVAIIPADYAKSAWAKKLLMAEPKPVRKRK